MKVIDLLNKIANGEEVPKKVKYKGLYWEYDKNYDDYRDNEDDWVFGMSNYDITRMLNNEVEILEEPKGIPEIDRLNNIINELEEWLEDKVFNKVGSSVDIAIENHTYCKVLDKLKELKENK